MSLSLLKAQQVNNEIPVFVNSFILKGKNVMMNIKSTHFKKDKIYEL